jgi:hypothetical protein
MALTLIHGQRRYIDAASRAAKRLLSQGKLKAVAKNKKTGPRGERSG